MISQYSSMDRFLKHVTIAVTNPKPGVRLNSVKVDIRPEFLASGIQTSYTVSATAGYDDRLPFAEYKDNPPRTHNIEDGKLDMGEEAKDFRNEITDNLRKTGLNLRVEDLSIEIPITRESPSTK